MLRALITLTVLVALAFAQEPIPPAEGLNHAFPARKHYSPYAGRSFPTRVFWGDTHVHTAMSMDAGAFGARLDPVDAYRFARGEEVTASTGLQVRLSRPLDFLVVADHSDNMGFFPRLLAGDPKFLADPTGKRWYGMIQNGGQEAVKVAVEVIIAFSHNKFPAALSSLPGSPAYRDAWDIAIDAAEKYNEPGKFTAFIGYEWTSNDSGNNLHRVLIYRDGSTKASMLVPYTTAKPLGSPDPRDLWKWMQRYEDKTGGSVLAIAHNGNLSNGRMFPLVDNFTGQPFDRRWAEAIAKWEPLYEATQIKGDGETHPFLSPDDEFADYETWDKGNLDLSVPKKNSMLEFEYARSGLQQGLRLARKLGINPYKVGFIGSTDTHTALSTAEENNFFGKHSGVEPSAERYKHPVAEVGGKRLEAYEMAASGYAAVWATENTRRAIFDAMQRKETYATTGPRMLVRFFGGYHYTAADAKSRTPARAGYEKGVPMGGDLTPAPSGRSPNFLVVALKDPIGANLDRIQIVKGWIDAEGKRREKVYNVAWSGARKLDDKGKLPPVGNTTDIARATWTNTIGAVELATVWTDPDFDPAVAAVYYARVLEIPTPRWTAYDAAYYKLKMPKQVKMITRERAYTSPIWYTPKP